MAGEKLTDTQRMILTNILEEQPWWHGMPLGTPDAGGWDSSYRSLLRRELMQKRGLAERITPAGRAALAENGRG